MSGEILLRVENLAKHFPVSSGLLGRVSAHLKAVDGVSFQIEAGSTLGLVGESGCGKTTVGQTLAHLLEPSGGTVVFNGVDLGELPKAELRAVRRDLQIVFQDPFNSLNPRKTVGDIVGEAMRVHGLATRKNVENKVEVILDRVGIPGAWMNRYPHEFSGGQRQRISIARAIALRPKLIVCDEAVSALDVSIQAQIINLLIDLREEMGLSFLFISHDLSVVKHISDRIAVMYLGKIVETAPSNQLFETAVHPYTRALLSAIPVPDPARRSERITLQGDVPTPLAPPPGCHFHTRCPAAMARCSREEPPLIDLPEEQSVRCFLAEDPPSTPDWHGIISTRTREAEAERATLECREDGRLDNAGGDVSILAEVSAGAGTTRIEDTFSPTTRAMSAALGACSLLLLASVPLAGPLLALAAFWLLMRPFAERKTLWTAVVVVGLAASSILGGVWESIQKEHQAEAQVTALRDEIERVASLTGRYPDSLPALGWRLPGIVGDVQARDPWGGSWQYRAPIEGEETFWLGSYGPDGQPGGGDDVGHPPDENSNSAG